MQGDGDVVDTILQLFVVALESLGNQFVDFALGDLGDDASAFHHGNHDGVQSGIHTFDDLRVGALELPRIGAFGEPPFLRKIAHAQHFLLQILQNDGDVVNRLLGLFVVAFMVLGHQFIGFAVGDLDQNAVAFHRGN